MALFWIGWFSKFIKSKINWKTQNKHFNLFSFVSWCGVIILRFLLEDYWHSIIKIKRTLKNLNLTNSEYDVLQKILILEFWEEDIPILFYLIFHSNLRLNRVLPIKLVVYTYLTYYKPPRSIFF